MINMQNNSDTHGTRITDRRLLLTMLWSNAVWRHCQEPLLQAYNDPLK